MGIQDNQVNYLLNKVAIQRVYAPERDNIILTTNIKHSRRRLTNEFIKCYARVMIIPDLIIPVKVQ